MKVIYLSSTSSGFANVYIKEGLLHALTLNGDTVISEVSSDDLVAVVRRQLQQTSSIKSSQEDVLRAIIIDITDVNMLEKILNELKNADAAAEDTKLPRLIVLSNFLTWSGKDYGQNILDYEDTTIFLERKPARGHIAQFQLENTMFSLHKRGYDICLVPIGLLYGGMGGHFKKLFKVLWGDKSLLQKGSENSLELSLFTTGRAPVMHISDVITLLCSLVTYDNTSFTLPFLIPASDGYQWNLEDLLQHDPELYKEIVETSAESSSLIPSSPSALLPSLNAIKCNLSFKMCSLFPLNYPCGLKESLKSIQSDYAALNCLSPFRAIIAGPPSSGKTEYSRNLAALLQIPAINIVSVVEYFINGNFEDLTDLEEALRTELEAIDTGGGKKKGGEAFDLKTVNITESMVNMLSKELLVKLIKCKVERDIVCARRGYILDLWTTHFQTVSGMLSIFTPEMTETTQGSDSGETVSPESETVDLNVIGDFLDLIIELRCSEEHNIRRWMVKNDQDVETQPAKLPKELAGGFKTFETDLANYNAKLIPVENQRVEFAVDDINKGGESTEEVADKHVEINPVKTHEDIYGLSKYGVNVHRVPTDELSIDDVCKSLKEVCLAKKTSFGWMSEDVEVVVEADFPQNEDISDAKVIEPDQNLDELTTELTEEDNKFIVQECAIYEKYSLENILPDLTSLLLSIRREKPTDPLLEAINRLATKAVAKEKLEEEKSREEFNATIEKSNQEIAEKMKKLQL